MTSDPPSPLNISSMDMDLDVRFEATDLTKNDLTDDKMIRIS